MIRTSAGYRLGGLLSGVLLLSLAALPGSPAETGPTGGDSRWIRIGDTRHVDLGRIVRIEFGNRQELPDRRLKDHAVLFLEGMPVDRPVGEVNRSAEVERLRRTINRGTRQWVPVDRRPGKGQGATAAYVNLDRIARVDLEFAEANQSAVAHLWVVGEGNQLAEIGTVSDAEMVSRLKQVIGN